MMRLISIGTLGAWVTGLKHRTLFRYIGTNILSASIQTGDTVESNNFINVINGALSLNFGTVDVPAGSVLLK